MIDKNDFAARLRAGEDPDTIAKEMTDALNDAIEEVEAEKCKDEKLEQACVLLNEWVHEKYGEKTLPDFDADMFKKSIEATVETVNRFVNLEKNIRSKKDDVDSIIEDFLDKFVN